MGQRLERLTESPRARIEPPMRLPGRANLGSVLPAAPRVDCTGSQALRGRLAPPLTTRAPESSLLRMLKDSVLPAEIRPSARADARVGDRPRRAVLVTGATGFLGAHLVDALLRFTPSRIVCPVRAESDSEAMRRVQSALESHALPPGGAHARLEAIACDLRALAPALSPARLEALGVDALYHCAAAVSWVRDYEALRESNVLATRELLALACRGGARSFHFVSSALVCYPMTESPRVVREDADVLAFLSGLPLGYAQTKCVAEALVREAAARGLSASIFRPVLVTGAAASGMCNADDLVSRLLRACVATGRAPDLDWMLDFCPVDFVAESIVRLSSRHAEGERTYHFANPSPRHWREAVLWMNLHGYPVRLVPYGEWVGEIERDARDPAHPLHGLIPFFGARTASGDFVAKRFEEARRNTLGCGSTREALRAEGVTCPPLSGALLERYFASFVARGLLPAANPVRIGAMIAASPRDANLHEEFFEPMLRRHFRDDSVRVRGVRRLALGSDESILGALAEWGAGSAPGLSCWRIALQGGSSVPRTLELVVKRKPKDEVLMDLGMAAANLAGPRLGRAFAGHRAETGLASAHLRELAVYAQRDPRFVRHSPRVYGIERDDARRRWILVLERINKAVPSSETGRWRRDHIEIALAGIAEIHSIWYGREPELTGKPWIGVVMTAARMSGMADLWTAAAEHSRRKFGEWAGEALPRAQERLILRVGEWWREMEAAPRTLIHNDFNPRNLALRSLATGLRLCAYDWELATIGLPQHDVAELLCFVLDPQCTREEALHCLEVHRRALERATGRAIDPEESRRGLALSLADLIVSRLPMYAMINTAKRQAFLERVVRTWSRLHLLFPVE